jgi:hypothetical protein
MSSLSLKNFAFGALSLTVMQNYLVLSGGFGSSPYVRQRLVESLTLRGPDGNLDADGMHILVADEP